MIAEIYNLITPNKYIYSIVIFFAFYISSEIVVLIAEKVFLRFTKKTKTELDDLFVKKTSKPISLILIFIGIRLSMSTLNLGDTITSYTNKIMYSMLIICISYIIVVGMNTLLLFWGEIYAKKTKSTTDDHLISLATKASKIIGAIVGLLMVLSVWGIQIGPFLASLGIAGIAVAFALQKSLGNIFGGVSLILDKTIKVGDVVYLDAETKGTVLDVGLRSTRLKTFDNEVIIVPNGELENMKVQNIVQPDPSARVVIPFGVAYGSDIQKVKKIVEKEINTIDGILKEPEPLVRFIEMGDSALLFKAYFWMNDYSERFRSIDEANTKIYNAFNKAKIEIPFPQMDVHMKKR